MSIGSARLGNGLVIAGAVVGAATVTAMALGFSPQLSEYMINLLFYKGLGAAAIGLIVIGTWIARGAHRGAPSSDGAAPSAEDRLDAGEARNRLADATLHSPLDELGRPDGAKQSVRAEQRTD